jgi:hypothetical protein
LKISGLLALCTPPKKDLLLVLAWQVFTVVCSSSDPAGIVASSKVWLLSLAVAEWGTSSLAWLTWRRVVIYRQKQPRNSHKRALGGRPIK